MKRGLYRKIGLSNIRKNYRFYIPRILSEAGLLGCFYIAVTLAMDERLSQVRGGNYIPFFMVIGTAVLALLSVILMFYTNSFLMKQRKSEFGLYNILGMEKKHVAKVLFHESFFSSIVSIIGGLCLGMLFYKICSLLICKLLMARIVIGFYFINPLTLGIAGGFFLLLDIVTYLYNRITINKMKPVELIKSKSTGEKEPKVKWLMLLAGVATLGAGYFISITTKSPLQALGLFFVAVVLVIIGTYFLFVTGTTFVLKLLKKNEKYYYNKKHMPSVSGLLYRMKQNAVGLASIAILATGVLVMISTTVSLYSGMDGSLEKNYPQDMYFSAQYQTVDGVTLPVPEDKLEEFVSKAADKNGVGIKSFDNNEYLEVAYYLEGNTFSAKNELYGNAESLFTNNIVNLVFITKDVYEGLTGDSLDITGNEIAFCRISSPVGESEDPSGTITIHDKQYEITENVLYYPISVQVMFGGFRLYGIVVSDDAVLKDIYDAQKVAFGEYASEMTNRICVTFDDRDKACEAGTAIVDDTREMLYAYAEALPSVENPPINNIDSYWEAREAMIGMFGTLLFLGILLGAVCLFATVLIIYYKQISEGYEDRERFQIMEKIGMSRKEVKQTINSQVLLVFFLPLVVAGVHMAVAFPLLTRMLNVLALYKASLFLICTLITYAVFALVYVLIYKGTSRTYYKIIR